MLVYDGVIQDRVVVLPEDVQLADGLKLEVRVLQPKRRRRAEAPSEEVFKRRLTEVGLLHEAKAPYHLAAAEDCTPVQVAGKPVSELIIEERR